MIERDNQDSKRKISPLKMSNDCFFIDTSDITELEVFELALTFIKKNADFI